MNRQSASTAMGVRDTCVCGLRKTRVFLDRSPTTNLDGESERDGTLTASDHAVFTHALNISLVRPWRQRSAAVEDSRPDTFRPIIRWTAPLAGTDDSDVEEYSDQVRDACAVCRIGGVRVSVLR